MNNMLLYKAQLLQLFTFAQEMIGFQLLGLKQLMEVPAKGI